MRRPSPGLRLLATRANALLARRLERQLHGVPGALAEAKLLGRRQRVPGRVTAAYRDAGVLHVLAISGLHLGLLTLFCGALLRLLGLPLRCRAILLIIIALAYAFLVDLRPPVVRAACMLSLHHGAVVLRQRPDSPSAFLVACALSLLIEPRWILSPSFQLSYAAVAGILYLQWPGSLDLDTRLARTLLPRPGPVRRYLREATEVTLAVMVPLTPLVAAHFQRVTLASIPGNPLIVPISSLSLASAWLSLVPGVVVLAAPAASCLLHLEVFLARAVAAVPGLSAVVIRPSPGEITAYYVALAAVLLWSRRPRQTAVLLMLATVLLWAARPVPDMHVRISGRGVLAELVVVSGSVTVQVESGSPAPLARRLRQLGIDHVDRLVLPERATGGWLEALQQEGIDCQAPVPALPRPTAALLPLPAVPGAPAGPGPGPPACGRSAPRAAPRQCHSAHALPAVPGCQMAVTVSPARRGPRGRDPPSGTVHLSGCPPAHGLHRAGHVRCSPGSAATGWPGVVSRSRPEASS